MSAFTLKLIAFVLMAMDHMAYYIIYVPLWFRYIGRIVAPIYFFLLVESFFHTRDKVKFNIRLFGFAAIAFLILNVLFKQPMNIFASMALGILMLNIIEFIKKRDNIFIKFIGILAVIAVAWLSLFTESRYFGVGMVLIFYFLREKKLLMSIAYVLFSIAEISFAVGSQFFIQDAFYFNYQWMMAFAIIPILLYNGKAGYRSKFFKYFFYIGYIVHIILILIIANSINPPGIYG